VLARGGGRWSERRYQLLDQVEQLVAPSSGPTAAGQVARPVRGPAN